MNRQDEGLKFARIYRIERIDRSRVVEDENAWPARSTLDYESGQTARRPIRDSAHACRMKLCISHFFPRSVDNATVALVPGCHLWKSHAIIRRQIWAAAVYSKFGLFLFLAPTFCLDRPWSRSPLSSSFLLSSSHSADFTLFSARARSRHTRVRSLTAILVSFEPADVFIGWLAYLE